MLSAGDGVSLARASDSGPGDVGPPRGWLIEPDPALIRAGLVTSAGRAWGATQLDETIAYLTADDTTGTAVGAGVARTGVAAVQRQGAAGGAARA